MVVTRPRHQAPAIVGALEELGADVVSVPTVRIERLVSAADIRAALLEVRPEVVVLTSTNAARMVVDAVGPDALAGSVLCCIGPETAAPLRRAGLTVAVMPHDHVAEALADAVGAHGVAGRRVWLPRAEGARDVLPDRLREAGAEVTITPLYRAAVPEATPWLLAQTLRRPVDAVTFSSSSTVRHFCEALGDAPFPEGAVAVCIGPVTAATARELGLPVAAVAAEHTAAGLVRAVCEALGAR